MSRIGKLPVPIPAKVKVAVAQQNVKIEGPKGHLEFELPGRIRRVLVAAGTRVVTIAPSLNFLHSRPQL